MTPSPPAVIIGTRAEFLKCVPLFRHFQQTGMEYQVVLTGQNEVDDLITDFDLRQMRLIELKSFRNVSVHLLNGIKRAPALLSELRRTLSSMRCSYVAFHGDTATTFTAALASSSLNLTTVHIEAGLRSHSLLEPFPEEFFRVASDRRSKILFTPSEAATANLYRERIKGEIVHSGNTITDLLTMILGRIGGHIRQKDYVLMTSHRYENIFIRGRLKRIINTIRLSKLPVYWPLHKMTEARLKKFGLLDRLRETKVDLMPPLPYERFIRLLTDCTYVITDGGSIEEESVILHKPCLLLRNRTERGEGIKMGLTFLTGLNLQTSEQVMRHLEKGEVVTKGLRNPYVVDGSPTIRIANYLKTKLIS